VCAGSRPAAGELETAAAGGPGNLAARFNELPTDPLPATTIVHHEAHQSSGRSVEVDNPGKVNSGQADHRAVDDGREHAVDTGLAQPARTRPNLRGGGRFVHQLEQRRRERVGFRFDRLVDLDLHPQA